MANLTKVLLVDDKREYIAVLARRLAQRDYSVTFTHSGKDALTKLEEDKDIDVVILDVVMPVLDGIETLKMIRKKWPLVEVLMLTGHSSLDSAINAIKLGAYDYLVKPVEMEQLVLKIESAAGRKRHRDKLILEVYMTPYLTLREREERVAGILDPEIKSSDA